MKDYRYSIVDFTKEVLKEDIQPWQERVMVAIENHMKDHPRKPVKIAIAGGHGCRKTATAGIINSWFHSVCRNPLSCVTANKRILAQTKTRRAIEQRMPPIDGYSEWGSVFYASALLPEDFAGFMGDNILMIFDEASGIQDLVWEVASSAFVDEGGIKIHLALGVAHSRTDGFAKCFTDPEWLTFHVDSRENSRIDKEFIEELAERHGEESNYIRTRIRGLLPTPEVD